MSRFGDYTVDRNFELPVSKVPPTEPATPVNKLQVPTLREALSKHFHMEVGMLLHDYNLIISKLQIYLDTLDGRIGKVEGIRARQTTATDVTLDIIRDIERLTPSMSSLIRKAAELDKTLLTEEE